MKRLCIALSIILFNILILSTSRSAYITGMTIDPLVHISEAYKYDILKCRLRVVMEPSKEPLCELYNALREFSSDTGDVRTLEISTVTNMGDCQYMVEKYILTASEIKNLNYSDYDSFERCLKSYKSY